MIMEPIPQLAKISQPFKFHRVGFYDRDDNEISGWLAKIETKEQLDIWYRYMAGLNAEAWSDIKDSPQYKAGHCRTTYASIWKTILDIEMTKTGRRTMSMVECVNFIELNSTKIAISIFHREDSVYVNKNGGCRDTRLRNDGRLDEHIFDRCTNRDFLFPSVSKKDVEIKRWAMGRHFYIIVDGKTVQVNDQDKFNTIKAAEAAKKEYLKNNRFKMEYLPNILPSSLPF